MNPFDIYQNCTLCPRTCQVDRNRGKPGVCGETASCRVSFIGPHFGEEPSFTGTRGSGTIFFSGCSSHCFFCQNYQISFQHEGRVLSLSELIAAVQALIQKEVHNLNFVTPDHFWPHIQALCACFRKKGVVIPKIFNSSGYQKPELVAAYAEWMDIFMPDFKFADPDLAFQCMGDRRYPELALNAIQEMVQRKGFLEPWDPTGKQPAQHGVLVRHLVLPGHVDNSLKVLRLLYATFGPQIPLSVMSQFQPVPECLRRRMLEHPLEAEEYEKVLACVDELGFQRVYTQELVEKTSFFPNFEDPENPFEGNKDKKK